MPEDESPFLLIEWAGDEYGVRKAGLSRGLGQVSEQVKAESQKGLNVAMDTIRSMAERVSHTIQSIEDGVRPDEVEVEFSLKLECESGAVVPFVAKTTGGGQFAVRFKWTVEQPQRAHVLVSEAGR